MGADRSEASPIRSELPTHAAARAAFGSTRDRRAALKKRANTAYDDFATLVTVIVSPAIVPVTFTLSPAYFAKPAASWFDML